MAKLLKLPNAQWPISAVFAFSWDDTMVNINGDELALGAEDADLTTFDIFTPPPGAIVKSGRVIVVTAFDSTANTLDVGDATDPNRYTETAPIDLKDPDAPASGFDLLGDGYVYNGQEAVRATILNTVSAATAGKAIIVVDMVVPGRANENLKTT